MTALTSRNKTDLLTAPFCKNMRCHCLFLQRTSSCTLITPIHRASRVDNLTLPAKLFHLIRQIPSTTRVSSNTRSQVISFHHGRNADTHRHVGFAAGLHGFGDGVDEVSGDAEVAHLDVSVAVDEDVRRLHIAVHHLQLRLQIVQRLHHLWMRQRHVSVHTLPQQQRPTCCKANAQEQLNCRNRKKKGKEDFHTSLIGFANTYRRLFFFPFWVVCQKKQNVGNVLRSTLRILTQTITTKKHTTKKIRTATAIFPSTASGMGLLLSKASL